MRKTPDKIFDERNVPCFYVLPDDVRGDEIFIREGEAKHAVSALRMGQGDLIRATDGRGKAYSVRIEEASPRLVRGAVIAVTRHGGEPVTRLTLAQALTKGTRMDMVVEKGTEIGVNTFIPMLTERTVVDGRADFSSRLRRWRRLAISAMKQSGRSWLPTVEKVTTFQEVLKRCPKGELCMMACIVPGVVRLSGVNIGEAKPKEILLFIGPEGGFSGPEISRAQEHGVILISLGPRRLRSETAGIVASALLLYEMGELE